MADLIDRQAAIDAVKKLSLGETDATRLAMRIGDYLERLMAQHDTRWIPVTERLPEKDQVCIVTDETRSDTYEYRFCNQTYDDEKGWTYLRHRIIAWMPLPKPYEMGRR